MLQEVGAARVFARGARKRCPRCGERDLWTTWFRSKPRCPSCDLRFEQQEGGYLGAMVINYTVACGFWLVMMAVSAIFLFNAMP